MLTTNDLIGQLAYDQKASVIFKAFQRMVIMSYSCYYRLLSERVYRSTHRW